ncbi:surface glycoprotein, partial [Natrinema sp. LN54]|uniref:surface glycoprotein n=1 Tax=Natrinema sp. LN54 TaxID=3458705 RepID=UPI00403646F0
MTSEPTYREKGRAVVLAALMVLSVVAMSAAFAGSAAAVQNADTYTDGETYHQTNELESDNAWMGQEITITGVDANGLEIREGLDASETESDDRVTFVEVNEDDEATIDTTKLEAGQPYVIYTGDSNNKWHGVSFWVKSEELDVSFDQNRVSEGSSTNFEFETERSSQ